MSGISNPKGTGRWRPAVGLAAMLAVAAVGLAVAGCGSSSTGSSSAASASAAASSGTSSSSPSSASSGSTKPIKVGFVYLGEASDQGWNDAMNRGRQYVQQHVPGAQAIVLQNVAEANAAPALQELVSKGCKIIFATSFGYGPGVLRVAHQNPDVKFEWAAGITTAPNVSTYFAKHWEAAYLLGMLAAYSTKTGTLGYVGAFPIGEVVGEINAYTLGAQSVKPNIKVKTVLINSWDDPAAERQAATALMGAGADSLMSINDTPSVLQQAAQQGKTASSSYTDMERFGPSAFLSGILYNWGPYEAQQVQAVQNGTWKSQNYWGGLDTGMITLAPYGKSVSSAAMKAVDVKLKGFENHTFNPFKGPIKGQTGAVKVPAGQAMTQSQIVGWSWYVQGVEGKA